MSTMDVRGTAVYYEDTAGEGDPILFLHGFLFDGRQYDGQVAELGAGHRCVALDFPGQGRSGPSTVGYSTAPLTDLVIDVIDRLDLGAVHLVGLSMGGFTAMRIAANRPELVRSLCLLNTSANAHARTKFPKQLALAAVARTLGTGLPPITAGIEDEMYGPAFRSDPSTKVTRDTWRQRWADSDRAALVSTLLGFMTRPDFRDDLSRITAPTLIVAGGADRSLPPAQSLELHERIADSQLLVLRGVGHSAPLEAPGDVTAALHDFLAPERIRS